MVILFLLLGNLNKIFIHFKSSCNIIAIAVQNVEGMYFMLILLNCHKNSCCKKRKYIIFKILFIDIVFRVVGVQ